MFVPFRVITLSPLQFVARQPNKVHFSLYAFSLPHKACFSFEKLESGLKYLLVPANMGPSVCNNNTVLQALAAYLDDLMLSKCQVVNVKT